MWELFVRKPAATGYDSQHVYYLYWGGAKSGSRDGVCLELSNTVFFFFFHVLGVTMRRKELSQNGKYEI